MLEEALEKAGLDKKEVRIYLAVLELGQASILEIAKKTKLNRSSIYNYVDQMIDSKLLGLSVRKGHRVYTATSPDAVKQLMKERTQAISEIVPGLLALASKSEVKPKVRFLEGFEGIKTAFMDTLETNGELQVFIGFKGLLSETKALERFWYENWYPKKRKNQVHSRAIAPDDPVTQRYKSHDKEQLRETRMVPKEHYSFKSDILIFDDVVTFISITGGEKFALEIKSAPIADTLRMIWEITWNTAY